MCNFTVHTLEAAKECQQQLGSVGNARGIQPILVSVMTEPSAICEGYHTLAEIFDDSDLNETERQIVLLTNHRLNDLAVANMDRQIASQMQGLSVEISAALRNETAIPNLKLESLRIFVEKNNLSGWWPKESDINDFLAVGYTRQTIIDVMIIRAGLKILSNYTNHVAKQATNSIGEKTLSSHRTF